MCHLFAVANLLVPLWCDDNVDCRNKTRDEKYLWDGEEIMGTPGRGGNCGQILTMIDNNDACSQELEARQSRSIADNDLESGGFKMVTTTSIMLCW